LLTLAVLARKKKKAPADGSENGGMFECTEVYIYGYFNNTQADGGIFSAWDWAQITDTDDNGNQVKMLDKDFLNGICTGIPYQSDHLAEIDVGDPVLAEPTFYSWLNYNKKSQHYGYKQEMVGGPTPANRSEDTTWEGGTARDDVVTIETTEEVNATTGVRTVVETTTEKITLTTENIVTTKYIPSARRLLGDDDDGPPVVETINLPNLLDTCGEGGDPDHPDKSELDHPFPVCKSRTFEWSCEMNDLAAMTARMKELKELQADDCWTTNQYDVKCPGAPVGAQTCTLVGGEIEDGEFVVGVKITVDGDRCKACSLKSDLCPTFYDVHSCTYEFIRTTNQQLAEEGYYDEDGESREENPDNDANHAREFRIVYEINAGPASASTSLLSIAVAILVWFASMP